MRYLIYNKDAQPIFNPHVNGAAWIVDNYKVVANADEEMLALGVENLKTTAIIDEKSAQKLSKITIDSTAKINIEIYEPNKLIYKSEALTEQIAVFSEIFYDKGWNVYIDGEKAEYFRANYLFRAMVIPAGSHEIIFKFEPQSFKIGNNIAKASSILLIILLGIGIYTHKKKKE